MGGRRYVIGWKDLLVEYKRLETILAVFTINDRTKRKVDNNYHSNRIGHLHRPSTPIHDQKTIYKMGEKYVYRVLGLEVASEQ